MKNNTICDIILDETKTPETVKDAEIMPGKSNMGLVIAVCCGVVAVVAVAVIFIIAKKKILNVLIFL